DHTVTVAVGERLVVAVGIADPDGRAAQRLLVLVDPLDDQPGRAALVAEHRRPDVEELQGHVGEQARIPVPAVRRRALPDHVEPFGEKPDRDGPGPVIDVTRPVVAHHDLGTFHAPDDRGLLLPAGGDLRPADRYARRRIEDLDQPGGTPGPAPVTEGADRFFTAAHLPPQGL